MKNDLGNVAVSKEIIDTDRKIFDNRKLERDAEEMDGHPCSTVLDENALLHGTIDVSVEEEEEAETSLGSRTSE